MRTTKDHQGLQRVLLSSFIEQKQTYRIKKNDGTHVDLYTGEVNSSLDGWVFKPTVGTAMSEIEEIKVGDQVLCPYMVFENDAIKLQLSDLKRIGIEPEQGVEVFSVSKDMCWMGIRNAEMFCINDNMICKRIYRPAIKSSLTLVQNRNKYETYVYVEQMPEDPSKYDLDGISMSEIKVGDIIGVKPMSDVEFKYVIDNEHKSLIRVNFRRDFLGIINNNLEYEF